MSGYDRTPDFSRPYEAYEELDLNDGEDIDLNDNDKLKRDSKHVNNNNNIKDPNFDNSRNPWQSSGRSLSYSSDLSHSSSFARSSLTASTSGMAEGGGTPDFSSATSNSQTSTGGSGTGIGSPSRYSYTSRVIFANATDSPSRKGYEMPSPATDIGTGDSIGKDRESSAGLGHGSTQMSSEAGSSSGAQAGKKKSRKSWDVPLVLGVAVVDFNHLIGPTVEFAYPPTLQSAIEADESLNRLLPFLALPDGAHLSEEDYSYFHCTYNTSSPDIETPVPTDQTLFGISCNRQLASSDLLHRPSDVTRSMVQKAVVVIASKPVFGPIRDQLGVVTRAYFAQRDFTRTDILEDFYNSLELTLEGKADESAIYMGTSLRELVHKFRHRTLVLLKMLMLQRRIMLFGYPVEKLCTYQYSLVSLIPGLLLSLNESGSPDLDFQATRTRPTSLRTSDRSSLLRYMGLPLHLFGKNAFFQPYLPLQQVDMLKTGTWLIGTTNQIVTQQKDCKYDLLVNIDNMTFEFSDSKVERMVSLTPADRRWMDDVVKTVEETWNTPDDQRANFRGSDDDLRSRFEEYICAALASIKYADFVAKGKATDVAIVGSGQEGNVNVLSSFGEQWISAFRTTQAYATWNGCTDPVLFDLCEPRHPCDGKASAVSDLGLRIAEGIHDLKIDHHLSPTRDALSSAFAAGSSAFATGSSSLFRAFDGVRNDFATRMKEREEGDKPASASATTTPVTARGVPIASSLTSTSTSTARSSGSAPAEASPNTASPQIAEIRATLGGIGSGIGSFFGSRVASLRGGANAPAPPPASSSNTNSGGWANTGSGTSIAAGSGSSSTSSDGKGPPKLRPMSLMGSSTAASGRHRTVSGSSGLGS